MNEIKSVLVICLGNICRSPYAEIKLKSLIKQNKLNIIIESAGISAMVGEQAHPNSILIANQKKMNLISHRARQLNQEMIDKFDLLLCMDDAQCKRIKKDFKLKKENVFKIGHWNNLDIEDPYGYPYDAYIKMAEKIDNCLEKWMNKFKD